MARLRWHVRDAEYGEHFLSSYKPNTTLGQVLKREGFETAR